MLEGDGFQGAFEYHDAQMYAPERIALECLIDADAHGAAHRQSSRGRKAAAAGRRGRRRQRARRADAATRFDIRARTDSGGGGSLGRSVPGACHRQAGASRLLRSKGIHLLLPEITKAALTVEAGGGHFFVLPWRGHTLLGTTDTRIHAAIPPPSR